VPAAQGFLNKVAVKPVPNALNGINNLAGKSKTVRPKESGYYG
jgi:hypothetical protein